MIVELIGGPFDGLNWPVRGNQKIIILIQPAMSPAEFISMGERPDLVTYAEMEALEHAYYRGRPGSSGQPRYTYGGVRSR